MTLNSRMPAHTFRPHDPIAFTVNDREECGFIASIRRGVASVVVEDGNEYRVSLGLLRLRPGVAPKRVRTRNESARSKFKVNDRVAFLDGQGARHEGRVVKINPKYARVAIDGKEWQVGYVNLQLLDEADSRAGHEARLAEIEAEADRLLRRHGLQDWRFLFDHAASRGGRCSPRLREISVSEQFALVASQGEVTDTLLHEIAHALVGPNHGHDEVWKATAKRIGCSGRVTLDEGFATYRWVATCRTCKWRVPRNQRRRGMVCKTCDAPVTFEPYHHDTDGETQANV